MQERKQSNHGNRDKSDVATNQGMLAPTRRWKKQRMHFPLEPPEVLWPLISFSDTDFGLQPSRTNERIHFCCLRLPNL